MQNFRTKARASSGIFSGKKVAACMLSVAVAAVIFWGITLTGNTEHSDEQMTVAQALRAAGDTLSANADPTKFTGGISSRVKMMELEEQGQVPSDDEAEQEAEDVQALLKEDEEIVTGKFLGASQRGGSTLETKTVVEEEVIAYPVHPGEIPYGTRMYITSADNSFVYGFAIAADTGLGLLGDVIDVDLYYDTYLESCLNGKRNVNIYLLD